MTPYVYDFAAHCFDDLLQIEAAEVVSWRQKYNLLYDQLVAALNDRTRTSTLEFAGPFARLDYLCRELKYKEHNALAYQAICRFRGKCTHLRTYDEVALMESFIYDLKALVDFLSFIYQTDVPEALRKVLPAEYLHVEHHEVLARCVRVAVQQIEEEQLEVSFEDGSTALLPWKIQLRENQVLDISYLRKMVRQGTQLNLVAPWIEEGVLHPEQVIYEPDYLVEISSVARCFSECGNSPYQLLVDRMCPSKTTSAILLGNLAGQMLDEEVRGLNAEYKDSVSKFFTQNALQIVTCDDMSDDFHQKAREQQTNIRRMVQQTFKADRTIDLQQVVLEPSFFCECLGLQGRMDLLQDDKHVLMEQKSGKMDEYRRRHKETHFVQVLLYQAMLHYAYSDNDGEPLGNDDIASYLLYSKYPDGLLKESPAPSLLQEALMYRNQLAHLDLLLSRGDGRKIYEALSPAMLHEKGKADTLWERYTLPQLEAAFQPLRSASSLEKDYIYRLLQFVAREMVLGKMGNSRKEASGFAALWNCTPEQKCEAGNLLDQLTILKVNDTFDQITLQIHDDETDCLPNFREGDIVVLYAYADNEEPDARRDKVLRATVEGLSSTQLVLRLRAPQSNHELFLRDAHSLWAVEHDFMEAGFSCLFRGIFSFLSAPKRRRDLLMGQRAPETDDTLTLNGDYGRFNELVLKAKQARDFFLLVGPPGTGKTSCGLVNILNETLSSPESSVLIVSYTNRAVDEICSKLVQMQQKFTRLGSEIACPEEYREHLLSRQTAQCPNARAIRNLILGAMVVVGTTTMITSNISLLGLRSFDLCIIDEASQILEPHLLAMLSAKNNGEEAIRKFVMIGDHKQLPAVVQQSAAESEVADASLREIGLENVRNSLFERLHRMVAATELSQKLVLTLSAQGRMHHDVAAFANHSFYGSMLTEVPLDHQQRDIPYHTEHQDDALLKLLTTRRVAFLDVPTSSNLLSSPKTNEAEARVVAQLVDAVWRLYEENHLHFEAHQTVGVIVPYRHQISIIRKQLEQFCHPELLQITIDTVERYQGSQRDFIIYGFTVSRAYQLDFLTNNVFVDTDGQVIDRKLNVALTRARECMLLVGNARLLMSDELFASLITSQSVDLTTL